MVSSFYFMLIRICLYIYIYIYICYLCFFFFFFVLYEQTTAPLNLSCLPLVLRTVRRQALADSSGVLHVLMVAPIKLAANSFSYPSLRREYASFVHRCGFETAFSSTAVAKSAPPSADFVTPYNKEPTMEGICGGQPRFCHRFRSHSRDKT